MVLINSTEKVNWDTGVQLETHFFFGQDKGVSNRNSGIVGGVGGVVVPAQRTKRLFISIPNTEDRSKGAKREN